MITRLRSQGAMTVPARSSKARLICHRFRPQNHALHEFFGPQQTCTNISPRCCALCGDFVLLKRSRSRGVPGAARLSPPERKKIGRVMRECQNVLVCAGGSIQPVVDVGRCPPPCGGVSALGHACLGAHSVPARQEFALPNGPRERAARLADVQCANRAVHGRYLGG